ncbi:MAG TPA: type II secretion system F family protein [Chloroflexota bacterium]
MIAGIIPPDQLTGLALLAGLGAFTVIVGLYVLFMPTSAEQRLAGFVGTYHPVARLAGSSAARGPVDLLGALDRQLRRRQQSASTRMLLVRANAALSVAELVALRAGLAVVVGSLVGLETASKFGLLALPLALVAGLLASYLPLVYLRFRAARRLAALETQLPDALDLIASSLQAGGALTQSFALIARDMPVPMSEEFQRVNREVEVGLSTGEALTNFADRVGSEDLDLVVTTIKIQMRAGGNLVQILRTINNTIRERIRIRGEINTLTAMQRLSSYVISGIPPVLVGVMYLLNPEYIGRLFRPGIGMFMLIISTIMSLVGFVVLQRLTSIDV